MKKQIALIALLLFPVLAFAQAPAAHVHSTAKVKIIDGEKNPELIPDSEAFQHFFSHLTTSATPTVEQSALQSSKLSALGLSQMDQLRFTLILRDFRDRQDDLIERYNRQATAAEARGDFSSNDTLLRQQLADLVTSVRNSIRTLDANSTTLLEAAGKEHKKKIKIQTVEAQ